MCVLRSVLGAVLEVVTKKVLGKWRKLYKVRLYVIGRHNTSKATIRMTSHSEQIQLSGNGIVEYELDETNGLAWYIEN